eukprot:GHVP01029279.1.p1 GENE.GHVP01029279.1~~GHVP01029279.1.p1  ORF type:complete len:184 (-),score=29.58 GHVP01029279.1:1141-1692(-)
MHPQIRKTARLIERALVRRWKTEVSKEDLKKKMMEEITTMLALLCLFQPDAMTDVQEIIYQGLRSKKIPEQHAAPTITPYFVEHNPNDIFEGPPNPSTLTRSQLYPPTDENSNLIQINDPHYNMEDDFTILNPELDNDEETSYAIDPSPTSSLQDTYINDSINNQDIHNPEVSYPFDNHIFDL